MKLPCAFTCACRQIAYEEWKIAVAKKEVQLIEVFRAYDVDSDGNLDIKEFNKVINDIDLGAAKGIELVTTFDHGRGDRELMRMYEQAVHDDDDDHHESDFIDPQVAHLITINSS